MCNDFEPFENVEEVWFWFCGCLLARGDGLRSCNDYEGRPRQCEIADIYRIVKRMKFLHQITNRHLRTMTKWGNWGCPPYYDRRAKRSEISLWEEGMGWLAVHLRSKGII